MRERAVRFGPGSGLVGILSTPAEPLPEAPGILLLNAGILHRVGACRLNVRLARRLAAEGFPVLRFDFSGIGDSEVRRDELSFEESSLVELREAMDLLTTRTGAKRFVPIGLCSGADISLDAACAEPRIAGIGLLDPLVYRTPGYYLRRYGPKLLKPSAYAHSIRVRLRPEDDPTELPSQREAEEMGIEIGNARVFPPKREIAEKLRSLANRGVEICCVVTGGYAERYNHEGQFGSCFARAGLGPRLLERYQPGADHIFTNLDEQSVLLDTLSSWTASRWGPAADRPAA